MGMDVKSFYKPQLGNEATAKRLALPVESQVPRVIPKREQKRLLQPDAVWRVFPRQQMAFDFARTCWQSVAVFAYECEDLGHHGQRRYLVTTYYHFTPQYLAMKPPRHYYEVITEGAVCHPYFDIEFKMQLNPTVQPLSLLNTFIEYVCYQLSVSFHLCCNRSHVLDLDSSTENKFSRHLIFHLPNAVFSTNIHAGNWVHYICDQLRRLGAVAHDRSAVEQVWKALFAPGTTVCPRADQLLTLFVHTDQGSRTLICDEGVYTRNRNFRLFLSSKLGRAASLTLARENKFKSWYDEEQMQSRRSRLVNIFLDTLVCNVSYGTSPRILCFESPAASAGLRRQCSRGQQRGRVSEGCTASPYPQVDGFITSCVARGGVNGAIRRWSFFPQEKLLIYDIKNNRWCENIQRAHKSNNIMIIADLQRGIYYQKCHDPECRRINFKSQEYPIPVGINSVVVADFGLPYASPATSSLLSGLSLEDLMEPVPETDCDSSDNAIWEKVASEMERFPDDQIGNSAQLQLAQMQAAQPRCQTQLGVTESVVPVPPTHSPCCASKNQCGARGVGPGVATAVVSGRGSHFPCGPVDTASSSCTCNDHEDVLFNEAYDAYESSFDSN